MKKILSLGMGVQTTALYYMSSMEEYERADLAIFADTGAEHPETFTHLQKLLDWQKKNNGIPVVVVAKKNILTDIQKKQNSTNHRWASIPAFSERGRSRMRRQCTNEYKIDQVTMALREWYGLGKHKWLPITEMWLGITIDEAQRMKDSQNPRIIRKFPFLDLMLSRYQTIEWLKKNGFEVPPKSACIFCPFKSDYAWQQLRKTEPEAFKQAIEIDTTIRDMSKHGIRNPIYLHRTCVPLDRVHFKTDMFDGFGGECEGVCGL